MTMPTSFMLVLAIAASSLAAAAEPLRIVAFGDSITGHRPGIEYRADYVKWTDLVQMVLEVQYGTGSVVVLNRGYAGDSTMGKPSGEPPGAVNRLQRDVLDNKPAICVMLIGGNNFAKVTETERPAREAQFRTDLTAMVGKAQAAGIKVLLVQYHAARADDPATAWSTLDDGNAIIAEVAKTSGAATVELEPAFAAALAAGATPAMLVNKKDGVHLNPFGETVVARVIARKLLDLGWIAR
jgi:lysophospholipase L1-like esterase